MTRSAVFWRANKEFIGVTLGTGHVHMFSGQREGCPIVIERGRCPAGRRMAGGTVRAEFAAVRIVL